jgi:hypothetical protein
MITEDIENIRNNGFDVEEIPTGYIFTKYSEGKQGNIRIHKEACEILQKIGKIEEIWCSLKRFRCISIFVISLERLSFSRYLKIEYI